MNFARAVLVLVDLLHVMITVLVIAGNHVVVTVLFRATILHVIHVSSTVVWVGNIPAVQVMVAVHVTEALPQVLAVVHVMEVHPQAPEAAVVLQTLAKVNVLDSAKDVRMIVQGVVQTTVKQNVQMIARVTVATAAQRRVQIIVRVALPIVRTIVG